MSIGQVLIKGLVAVCHSFCLFFIFSNIHTIIQSHSYNTFAEASLHLLIACKLSGTDLPVVPSRESNSGLPSSKPTRYQQCHAAPLNSATPHHINSVTPHHSNSATPHHATMPRRTITTVPRRPINSATPHH
jgi:hypothetical protein